MRHTGTGLPPPPLADGFAEAPVQPGLRFSAAPDASAVPLQATRLWVNGVDASIQTAEQARPGPTRWRSDLSAAADGSGA